eukprot:TRINITY_DN8617_c0_g1_i5.p1 TRINITY_DN8617_c0_g1~~TRINITY_DN8617_c0_g1_i5.p1  ORF type:complete len:451 (+),score=81.49 TRINITY_DN8617_c0_g1_i5:83-1435(+)
MSTNPNTGANTSLEQALLHSSSYLSQKAPNWRKLWTPYALKNRSQPNKSRDNLPPTKHSPGLKEKPAEEVSPKDVLLRGKAGQNSPRQIAALKHILTDSESDSPKENSAEDNLILAAYKKMVEKVRSSRLSKSATKKAKANYNIGIDLEHEDSFKEEAADAMRKSVEEKMNKYESELQELKGSILKVYEFLMNAKNDIEFSLINSESEQNSYVLNEESKGVIEKQVIPKVSEEFSYKSKCRHKPKQHAKQFQKEVNKRGGDDIRNKLLEELQSDVEYLKKEVKSTRQIVTPRKLVDNSVFTTRFKSKSIKNITQFNSHETTLQLNSKLTRQLEANMQIMEKLHSMNKEKEKELGRKESEITRKNCIISELSAKLEALGSSLHSLTERFSKCDTNELTLSRKELNLLNDPHHSQSMSITDLYTLSQNTLNPVFEKNILQSQLNLDGNPLVH